MVDSSIQRSGARGSGTPLDRYVVLDYLAEGGMGAIYLGKKMGAGGFEKEVVLKQLLPEFTQQPEFIDLFLREARLSATLDHANIIHTIDLVTAGDEYFIVMEYLPGADLRTLLKRAKRNKRRFSPAASILVAREVLSALSYAHAQNGPDGTPLRLIHRDISPSNILISRNGEVKLTDFGIAKASTHNSVFYRVKGKVGYMSPEQARSEPLDSRSDLYSLAVCLYEMLTGERLFVQAGLTTSANELYSRPIPLLSSKIPGIPSEFDKVMIDALAIDPNDRYQTAGEFQEALLKVAHRHGLMLSVPELARHLEEICGQPSTWRNTSIGGRAGTAAAEGTEIYESESLADVSSSIGVVSSSDSGAEFLEAFTGGLQQSLVRPPGPVGDRQTSITNLSRLQGIELTSLINLADLGDVGTDAGATPLVDLDAFQSDRTGEKSGLVDLATALAPELATATNRPSSSDSRAQTARDALAGRTWLVFAIILLLGIAIATAIGFSGPELPAREADGFRRP
jgi:serine/threonine protein kinase